MTCPINIKQGWAGASQWLYSEQIKFVICGTVLAKNAAKMALLLSKIIHGSQNGLRKQNLSASPASDRKNVIFMIHTVWDKFNPWIGVVLVRDKFNPWIMLFSGCHSPAHHGVHIPSGDRQTAADYRECWDETDVTRPRPRAGGELASTETQKEGHW